MAIYEYYCESCETLYEVEKPMSLYNQKEELEISNK